MNARERRRRTTDGRRLKRLVGAVAVAALFWPAAGAAGVVLELASGQRIEGTLRQASATRVLVEVGSDVLSFDAADVRAIYFASPEPPAAGASAAAPAARAAEPPPAPRVPGPVDALEVVKALRAAAERNPKPEEFSPLVGDAADVVDRYLASGVEAAPPGAEPLAEALRFYQLGEFSLRNRGVTSSTVWLRRDEALGRCEQYGEFKDEMQAKGEAYYQERTRRYLQISDEVLTVLWSCAADHVARAEVAIPLPKTAAKPDAAKPQSSASSPAASPPAASDAVKAPATGAGQALSRPPAAGEARGGQPVGGPPVTVDRRPAEPSAGPPGTIEAPRRPASSVAPAATEGRKAE